MDSTAGLLCVIIDCNPLWWGKLLQESNNDQGAILKSLINCIISYCSAYKFLSSLNHLLVLGAGTTECQTLYCDFRDHPETLREKISNGLTRMLVPSTDDFEKETKLAAGFAAALCYFNRRKKTWIPGQEARSRFFVLKLSDNISSEHMNLMNMFFTSQKQGVTIDACILGPDSTLLQQACDITSGIYKKVTNLHALLQYLLSVFLPDFSLRNKMLVSVNSDVDYRPACFCHHRLINIGWVCSVCLSVFCQFNPICSTCQSIFKFLPLPKPVKKRKRVE